MFQDYTVSFSVTQVALWLGGILASIAGTYIGGKAIFMIGRMVRNGTRMISQLRLAMVTLATTIAMVAGWVGTSLHVNNNWDAGIGSYLNAAIQTKDPQKASKYLNTAVTNMSERGQLDGFTSVAYQTPDEDLSDWSAGILEANEVANSTAPNEPLVGKPHAPWVERLIKHNIVVARPLGGPDETGKQRFQYDLKYPAGIGRAPYNAYFFWTFAGLLLGVAGAAGFLGMAYRKEKLKDSVWCNDCGRYHKVNPEKTA